MDGNENRFLGLFMRVVAVIAGTEIHAPDPQNEDQRHEWTPP